MCKLNWWRSCCKKSKVAFDDLDNVVDSIETEVFDVENSELIGFSKSLSQS